ncbi:MAG: PASTA domain-containing protein [Microthrixaceae bacterium]
MRWARGAAAAAVAVALLGFGLWLLAWSPNLDPVGAVKGEPPSVEVPDLSGLARPRAVADVEVAELEAEVETSFSLSAPRGAVIGQEPAAGAQVPAGSTVSIVVSRGVSRVEMPDAVGRPLDEAAAPLDELGVDYAVERISSETVAAGVVIDQFPEAGVRVTEADSISFVVSTGPEPRAVLDVKGLSGDGAAFALGSAGFTIGDVDFREEQSVVPGAVIETEPVAGTVSPRDTAVNLVISSGPPPAEVPDLVNRSFEDAVATLESLGLIANVSGGGPAGGRVASQTPVAGTVLPVGSLVALELRGG